MGSAIMIFEYRKNEDSVLLEKFHKLEAAYEKLLADYIRLKQQAAARRERI